MNDQSRRMKIFYGLAALVVSLFVATAGVAGAGTSQRATVHHAYAAQDQYTPKNLVKPLKFKNNGKPTVGAAAPESSAKAKGGVTLPFTGFSLVTVVLVGVGLIVLGFALRRRRPAARDHS
jgi:hypothetical protein